MPKEAYSMNDGAVTLKKVFSDFTQCRESPAYAQGRDPGCYTRRGEGYLLDKALVCKGGVFSVIARYRDTVVSQGALQYVARAAGGEEEPANAALTAGFTLCGTGRTRHTVFIIENPVCGHNRLFGADLVITGIPTLLSVEMVAGRCEEAIDLARKERPSPKECQPAFELERPMQLVSTADVSSIAFEDLEKTLERMREACPYIRVLGFNGVESYVRWNTVEYEKGRYDWGYYDAIIACAAEYGLKWFPLVIGGSAYALPEWYRESEGFTGFKCLEHGIANNVPTIFNDHQTPFIIDYLHAFGEHYKSHDDVFGCRLGPSGNYGESQYPASGNCGYKGVKEHMHLGWWAADEAAAPRFRAWLQNKYKDAHALSEAWQEEIASWEDVLPFLPPSSLTKRKRKDFVDWYMDEMSLWCEKWALWMREAMTDKDIYQSSGGWGFGECGTDFTDQTRSMAKIGGGIRATNEDESYELNFAITRMLSSAARFYRVPFGSEPAGFCTARGILARLYNIIVNNGEHFFMYRGNLQCCDTSCEKWTRYAPLLDRRAEPVIDVAVFYPDTMVKTDDSVIRYLDGSAFFSQVFALRRHLDFDYCSERMVLEGALGRYKTLVFLSRNHDGDFTEQAVLEKIDAWVRGGGTAIYPFIRSNARAGIASVEGDGSVFKRWRSGDTGKGKVTIVDALREPLDLYIGDIVSLLKQQEDFNPATKRMLHAKCPPRVYRSMLENGLLVFYNDGDIPARVELGDGRTLEMEPLSIATAKI